MKPNVCWGHPGVLAPTVALCAALLCTTMALPGPQSALSQSPTPATHRPVAWGKLPMRFEPNVGQGGTAQARFLARGPGYSLSIETTGATLALAGAPRGRPAGRADRVALRAPGRTASTLVRMELIDANPNAHLQAEDRLPGRANYLRGNDPRAWRTGVPGFRRVRAEGIWPGIDLVYYGNGRQLEYDFLVAPGAAVERIGWHLNGVRQVRIDGNGDLVMATAAGELRQPRPVVYQQVGGRRRRVSGRYVLKGTREVGFAVGAYDRTLPLVIDPVLVYSTFVGTEGLTSEQVGVATGSDGSVYLTGLVSFVNQSPTGAPSTDGFSDVFVARLDATGEHLLYITYFGGVGNDVSGPNAIAVGSDGSTTVSGYTYSANFPVTPGAFDTTFGGNESTPDAFVTRLDPSGNVLYSTFLGGSAFDTGYGIAVDGEGNAYVTGSTFSADYPTTPGAYSTAVSGNNDVFVTKLNPAGNAILYSTYLGADGSDIGYDIALAPDGSATVSGRAGSANFPTTPGAYDTTFDRNQTVSGFVARFNPSGSALVYSTFVAGSAFGLALGSDGSAYVTGSGGPGFLQRLNAQGSALIFSARFADNLTAARAVAVGSDGSAYVTGETSDTALRTTPNAYQPSFIGSCLDGYLVRFDAGGKLLYSTYLGGGLGIPCTPREGVDYATAIAADPSGGVYVAGFTSSSDYPTTVGAYDTAFSGNIYDGFITKFNFLPRP